MLFFYKKDGREFGPLTAHEFLAKIKSPELAQDILMRSDENPAWMTVAQFQQMGGVETMLARQQSAKLLANEADEARLRKFAFSAQSLVYFPLDNATLVQKAVAYGNFLEREFADNRPARICPIHPELPVAECAIFTWSGDFRAMDGYLISTVNLIFHVFLGWLGALLHQKAPSEIIAFNTVHYFSSRGAQVQRRHRIFSMLVKCIAYGLVVCSIFGLLCVVTQASYLVQAAFSTLPSRENHDSLFWYGLLVTTTLSIAAWTLFRQAQKLLLPRPLLNLEKPPLRLEKITWKKLR